VAVAQPQEAAELDLDDDTIEERPTPQPFAFQAAREEVLPQMRGILPQAGGSSGSGRARTDVSLERVATLAVLITMSLYTARGA
jgi:hypothetical protein